MNESLIYSIMPPAHTIHGSISLPGSKSYTNRALIAASLAEGESTLLNASESDDSNILINALRSFGAKIEAAGTKITVGGVGNNPLPYKGRINIGAAGTALRFLVSLAALTRGSDVEIFGSGRMHDRPIGDLVDALISLGAKITYLNKANCPPLRIQGAQADGDKTVELPGHISSQFLTSLLLASPLINGRLTINLSSALTSGSYLSMTEELMKSFGIEVSNDANRSFSVAAAANKYHSRTYAIEGDASGASYWWSAAALSSGLVTVGLLPSDSKQGDCEFPSLLEKMGCTVTHNNDSITVGGKAAKPISCSMLDMPDTAQTLAVIASTVPGKSEIFGLSTLKTKETDRIEAVIYELGRMGIKASGTNDSLTVYGGAPKPARIRTYDDHRMAMAFAPLSFVVPGLEIENPAVVNKSYPSFWDTLASLGFHIKTV
jgi:3-phosphoshikimate 1-carboxyvinyltransferase